MRGERFDFIGGHGDRLAARIDLPDGPVRAYALFAHCFTCGKDIHAASRISMALARQGVATVRFDFTGLGGSDGDFANTDFSSNIKDLAAAIDHLRESGRAPSLLIGHSLGGAAVLAVAGSAPEVRAVAVIGAPFDVAHVCHAFGDESIERIQADGEARVNLGGRPFTIRKSFLDDVAMHDQKARIAGLKRALLVLHSPVDQIVDVDNARQVFEAARHPKSFVSLDTADHLLTKPADCQYAADVIACWSARYLLALREDAAPTAPPVGGAVLVEDSGRGKFEQAVVTAAGVRFLADEPAEVGGGGAGPSPYDLLLSALGACTSMTVRLYADRKGYALKRTRVTLRHRRDHIADCESGAKMEAVEREIAFEGDLDAEARAKLMEIADKCPVHRTLSSGLKIITTAAEPGGMEGAVSAPSGPG